MLPVVPREQGAPQEDRRGLVERAAEGEGRAAGDAVLSGERCDTVQQEEEL